MLKVLEFLLKNAANSPFWRFQLNCILPVVVPFNAGHGFKVVEIGPNRKTKIHIPYRKSNYNHIKGIHACALATGAELCAGLAVLSNFSASKYRIIMSEISCEYNYQARKKCIAEVELTNFEKAKIEQDISREQKASIVLEVIIRDSDKQEVCKTKVNWQLKPWSEVATK